MFHILFSQTKETNRARQPDQTYTSLHIINYYYFERPPAKSMQANLKYLATTNMVRMASITLVVESAHEGDRVTTLYHN